MRLSIVKQLVYPILLTVLFSPLCKQSIQKTVKAERFLAQSWYILAQLISRIAPIFTSSFIFDSRLFTDTYLRIAQDYLHRGSRLNWRDNHSFGITIAGYIAVD
jgi:hypothetical protein